MTGPECSECGVHLGMDESLPVHSQPWHHLMHRCTVCQGCPDLPAARVSLRSAIAHAAAAPPDQDLIPSGEPYLRVLTATVPEDSPLDTRRVWRAVARVLRAASGERAPPSGHLSGDDSDTQEADTSDDSDNAPCPRQCQPPHGSLRSVGVTSMAPPPLSGIARAASPRLPQRPPSALQGVATSALAAPTSIPRPCSPGEVQLKRRRGLRLGVPQIADLMLRRPPSPTLQPRRKSARTCSPHALAASELNPTPSAPLVGTSASPSSRRGIRPPSGGSRPMPS